MSDGNSEQHESDSFMTVAEVSRLLRIPSTTIYTWRSRRPGYGPPAFKVRGRLRYRRSDVLMWAETFRESLGPDHDA